MGDDESSQQPAQQQAHGCLILLGLALAVGVFFGVVSALGGDSDTEEDDRQTEDAQPDSSAEVACNHWANVVGDIRDGVLTGPEVRTKVKEVNESARVSDNERVRTAAQEALRAATQAQDADELGQAFGELNNACQAEVFGQRQE